MLKFFQKNKLNLFIMVIITISLFFSLQYSFRNFNKDYKAGDQNAYINSALKTKADKTYLGDRNRMPVYSYLLSFFINPEQSRIEIFKNSIYFNIILTLILIWLLFYFLKYYLKLEFSLLLVCLTSFLIFIFRGSMIQVEILFYFINFLSFVLLAILINTKSNIKSGIITGLFVGLCFLTKANALLVLYSFLLIFVIKNIVLIVNKTHSYRQQLKKNSVLIIILLLAFLTITAPYLIQNKLKFGHFFYNVNTTFYIWNNSWEEAKQQTQKYGDREHWPNMPSNELPSLKKYIKEHSTKQIAVRELRGLKNIAKNLINRKGYLFFTLKYILLLLTFHILSYWKDRDLYKKLLKKYFYEILFVLFYFTIFIISAAWYDPIANGPRFISTLILPLLFTLLYLLNKLEKNKNIFYLVLWSQIIIDFPFIIHTAATNCFYG